MCTKLTMTVQLLGASLRILDNIFGHLGMLNNALKEAPKTTIWVIAY